VRSTKKVQANERLIDRMIRNGHSAGLAELLGDSETPAASARAALEGLIEIDSGEAWDALGQVLLSSDSSVVEMVIATLHDHASSMGAVRAIGESLGNPNQFVRNAAVRALSGYSHPQVMPLLLRASRDPVPSIGRQAARRLIGKVEDDANILSQIAEPTAEGIIDLLDVSWAAELLSDAYPDSVRMMAAGRLGAIGGEEATGVLVSVIEVFIGRVGDACWKAFESCGEVIDHLVLPLLFNKNPTVRNRSLQVYGRHGDATAEGMLAGFTSDADPRVRRTALNALWNILKEGSRPYVLKALQDEDEDVRLRAVEFLARLPDTSQELVDVVHRERGNLRRTALTALANLGIVTPELIFAYVEFILQGAAVTDLSDATYLDGIAAAAKALAQEAVPEGIIALTALVRSVIRRLRRVAIEGIMIYPPEERADALLSLQDAYDLDILKNVAFGLHEGGHPGAIIPLIRCAYECKGRPQMRARQIVLVDERASNLEFLLACLSNRWAAVRRFGAERLKTLRDPRSVPALLDTSRDEDVEVQLAVFEALSIFASDSQPVVDRMLEALAYGDISVRQMACESLGEARCKEAVPHLAKAIYNCFLRPRASEALRRIGDRKGILALKRLELREKLFPKGNRKANKEEERRKQAALADARS
jgi:HEAT repeat protein